MQHVVQLRHFLLVASAVAASSRATYAMAYDYKDIIPQYCHPDKDWGPIPERPADVTELKQVQVFIRHGARVPVGGGFCWDGDQEGEWNCKLNYLFDSVKETSPIAGPFREEFLSGRTTLRGNCLAGQLVSDGFDMEFNNGRRLKEAYVTREAFLPETLDGLDLETLPSVLSFRSTNIPRTMQSGMAVLSALYPSTALGNLPYIPLHTMDFSLDNMEVKETVCPAVKSATSAHWLSWPRQAEMLKHCRNIDHKHTYRDGNSNDVAKCHTFLTHVLDCMMSRMCPTVPFSDRNTTIPSYFSAQDWKPFREFWDLVDQSQWSRFNSMVEVGGMSSFVEEIFTQAKLAASGNSATTKFVFWSGHDTGPMEPLYAAFGLRTEAPYWPPFASMLVLEFWGKQDGSTVARWISNGKVEQGPMPWEAFSQKAQSIIAQKKNCAHRTASVGEGGYWMRTPVLVATVLGSSLFGAVLTWCILTQWRSSLQAVSTTVAAEKLGRSNSPLE